MSTTYSIGQLATAAGLPPSTIRYYERSGLLVPDGRTDSNYRVYGERSLERLSFLRAAQASGLTLDDVRILLALRDGSSEPCHEVRQVLERRLAEADSRLAQMRRVRAFLRSSLAACESSGQNGRCQTIDGLDQRARALKSSLNRAAKKKSGIRKP